jgi:predicted site-specific integrase-resolvase
MAKKALGYGRVSTVKQVVDGVSLEAQRMEITSFAIASGYDLLDVLCDDGISGSVDEDGRPALAELLEAVRAGQVSVVIVCKRERDAATLAQQLHSATVVAEDANAMSTDRRRDMPAAAHPPVGLGSAHSRRSARRGSGTVDREATP